MTHWLVGYNFHSTCIIDCLSAHIISCQSFILLQNFFSFNKLFFFIINHSYKVLQAFRLWSFFQNMIHCNRWNSCVEKWVKWWFSSHSPFGEHFIYFCKSIWILPDCKIYFSCIINYRFLNSRCSHLSLITYFSLTLVSTFQFNNCLTTRVVRNFSFLM